MFQTLQPEDYTLGTIGDCATIRWPGVEDIERMSRCLIFRPSTNGQGGSPHEYSILFSEDNEVLGVFRGSPAVPIESLTLDPQLFAQYIGDAPIIRRYVSLGQTPLVCLDALLAIEDSGFLEHQGVSITGLTRALISNILNRGPKQGGSTITQQLVKNYFLTPEKTIKRKVIEIGMSLVLEARFSKEDILETYINIIYLGQNGSFQVRGYGAASQFYFGKPLERLNLSECSLLAAIVNSPGLFNPFTKPENATKRRNKVLARMRSLNMISDDTYKETLKSELPKKPDRLLDDPAPYFIQASLKQIKELDISTEDGLKVYTSLDLDKQEAAQNAVEAGLKHIEKHQSKVKKLLKEKKKLQSVLIAGDPSTGRVQALIGGRNYRSSQFNRAIEAHRQVGSVMKPFVYLTALESLDETGNPYTPMTLLQDEKLIHRYDGQKWTPQNYDGKYRGQVPMFYALKESLNIPTARLGLRVGTESVVDTARRIGISSPINALPSLFLGAYELYPWEVLQAYSGLSRMGSITSMTLIDRLESLDGKELWRYELKSEQNFAPENVAVLVGMMKQTVENGTGQFTRAWGFKKVAAGKTGTTNETKDAWFAGFTPFHTAIAWVGYDDNSSSGLTGASGAIPIWSIYMRNATKSDPDEDFAWPESTEEVEIPERVLTELNAANKETLKERSVKLRFRRGNSPEY